MILSLALLAMSPQGLNADAIGRSAAEFFAAEMAEHRIPGAAFALVVGGELAHLEGFGYANLDLQTAVDPEKTVFRVGSISKTVTALAAMQLVDRGELDLESNINRYLGSVKVPERFSEPVTLFHLLTHTAGFDEFMLGQHRLHPREFITLEEYLAEHLPLQTCPPGKVIIYNDHGTCLAGLLVESLGSVQFASYVQEEIFAPLAMTQSSFEQVDLPEGMRAELALAYSLRNSDPLALPRDQILTIPAAGLQSSAMDMGRLIEVLLGRGQVDGVRILGTDAAEKLVSVQFRHGPWMRGRAFGSAEVSGRGRLALKKSGQASGFNAQIFMLPEQGVGWFSVINLSILGQTGFLPHAGIHDRLAQRLLREFFPLVPSEDRPIDEAPKPIEGSVEQYSGVYRDATAPRQSWDKMLLASDTEISAIGPGVIQFQGLEFAQVEPGIFQYTQGGPHFLRFVDADSGAAPWLAWHGSAYEPIPWYETGRVAVYAASVLSLILLLALAEAGLRWLRRSRRRAPNHSGQVMTVTSSAILLIFVLAFSAALLTSEIQLLFSGPSHLMRLLLLLPVVAAVTTVVAIVQMVRGRSMATRGAWQSLVLMACVMSLLLLHQWNLFGWRF